MTFLIFQEQTSLNYWRADAFARVHSNVCIRTYLITGNALEPFTTIAGKPRYDGLTTKGLAVHVAKHPNVSRRPCGTLVEGERSQTIPHEGFNN